jgi:hypothetical protein
VEKRLKTCLRESLRRLLSNDPGFWSFGFGAGQDKDSKIMNGECLKYSAPYFTEQSLVDRRAEILQSIEGEANF